MTPSGTEHRTDSPDGTGTDGARSRWSVFAHLTADKAPLYRAILGAFVRAKTRFALHLRPAEVLRALRAAGGEDTPEGRELEAAADLHPDGVEAALLQLCAWSNLERHVDTTEVATVADFYRPRYLYQLTPAGEAAQRAVAEFRRQLERPGELQTAALQDIQQHLLELLELARSPEPDAGKTDRNLTHLTTRFEELTDRAQTFLTSLQRTIDLQGVELESFLEYKELLIDYLERFIGELVTATANIASTLARVEAAGVDGLLETVARRRVADRLDTGPDVLAREVAEWKARWRGLASWFRGGDGPSQAEILRARARAAIPALLNAVAAIHDRRITRSDRTTDLRTLARWFAECEADEDAHRLWHSAFALGSCRHLRVDAATLETWEAEDVSPRTSWIEAPPLRLTPRLRKTGRSTRRGRIAGIVDHSADLRRLERLAADQRRQIDAARRALATDGPVLLSAIGTLDPDAFQLFLDLLGQALARRPADPAKALEPIVAASTDGALEIVLEPLPDAAPAVLSTPHGTFTGPDHRVEIRPSFRLAAAAGGA